MATENEIKQFRSFVSQQPEEARRDFIQKFKSLDSDEKREIAIQRVLERAGGVSQTSQPQGSVATAESDAVSPLRRGGGASSGVSLKEVGTELLRGTARGAAQTQENIVNVAEKSPQIIKELSKMSLGRQVIEAASKLLPDLKFEETTKEAAKPLREFIEKERQFAEDLPRSEFTDSIMGILTQAAPDAAQFIGRTILMGGGATGLALEGGISELEKGPKEAATQATINAALGKIFQGIQRIKPSSVKPGSLAGSPVETGVKAGLRKEAIKSGDKLSSGQPAAGPGGKTSKGLLTEGTAGIVRAALGGSLFAAPKQISGAPPEEVAAAAIEGVAGTIIPSKGKNLPETFRSIGRNIRRVTSKRKILENKAKRDIEEIDAEMAQKEAEFRERKSKATEEQRGFLEAEEQQFRSDVAEQKRLISEESKAASREKELIRREVKKSVKEENKRLDEEIKNLDEQIKDAKEQEALESMPRIQEQFRGISKKYGAEQDRIIESLDRSNEPMTRGEALDIVSEAIQRSKDSASITSGRGVSTLEAIQNKYSLEVKKPDGTIELRSPDDAISFRDFRKDIQEVNNLINFQKKPSQDEIPAYIFKSILGNWISERVPEFSSMQSKYSEAASAIAVANRVFKPFSSKFATETAEGTILKLAEGREGGGLRRLSEFLEKGSEFGEKPAGDVFKPVEKLVGQKRAAELRGKERMEKIRLEAEAKLDNINSRIENLKVEAEARIAELESGKSKVTQEVMDRFFSEIQKAEKDLSASIEVLSKSRKEMSNVNKRKIELASRELSKLNQIKRILSIVGVGAAGALTAKTVTGGFNPGDGQ